jgi:TPR repeat protein
MAYHNGAGTPKDDAQALFWARAAADKGHTEAASLVAVIEYKPPQ